MTDFVLIVAGGVGKRMGAEVPKQFLLLNDKPLLMHTLNVFHSYDPKLKIIITLPKEHLEYWNMLCKQHRFDIPHKVVEGGDKRFYSVKKGLSAIDNFDGIIAIQDGVRPLVSHETISRCFDCARKLGNAIPVLGVTESLRMKKQQETVPVDRDLFYSIQTPQVFKTQLLIKAYEQEFHSSFTDDATVVERMGEKIQLVEGNIENVKITTPLDLIVAEILLKDKKIKK